MKLPDDEIASIKRGVLLHDLGKLSIPNSVLRKPGKLSPDEWTMIRDHSLSGWKLLEGVSLLDNARRVTLEHHEAFWGGGYPGGMAGEEIYVGARIMAVVDAFDAITSRRSYKEAAPPSIALRKAADRGRGSCCVRTSWKHSLQVTRTCVKWGICSPNSASLRVPGCTPG